MTETAVTWTAFQAEEPELSGLVRARFEAHLHHILATLRRDGAPRLSGTEVRFRGEHIVLGMMPGSLKSIDLRRDPRCALHSAPIETDLADGDAKLSARAVEVTDPAEIQAFLGESDVPDGAEPLTDAAMFELHLTDVSLTTVRGNLLVIDLWKPGQPVRHIERA